MIASTSPRPWTPAGVHLGLDHLPVATVRKILGPEKIVGASAATVEEALRFEKRRADYLGVGAVFETATKLGNDQSAWPTSEHQAGREHFLSSPSGASRRRTRQPSCTTGVDGVAFVSSILAMPDVRKRRSAWPPRSEGAGK
jgi:thiamine-phosphate pyrophosphorylase